ncbi:Uncharacterised protein [Mycobacteroides abscessus subsp. abscessus]|nr:Uncharacterised protein [Mycobacteroides abscessus subsp. abscessus]
MHIRNPDILAERRGVQMLYPGLHGLTLGKEIEFLGEVPGEVVHHIAGREHSAHLAQFQ